MPVRHLPDEHARPFSRHHPRMGGGGPWQRDIRALRRVARQRILAVFSLLLEALTAGQLPQPALLIDSPEGLES
ncbi:MAG: hypothetical protein E6I85_03405 [Chloroflexi bacterium]|nr:MAG: hypothetical protein E6I85_03405 [Chloroflexota bacterium]